MALVMRTMQLLHEPVHPFLEVFHGLQAINNDKAGVIAHKI
jgi:hypothetical protein